MLYYIKHISNSKYLIQLDFGNKDLKKGNNYDEDFIVWSNYVQMIVGKN